MAAIEAMEAMFGAMLCWYRELIPWNILLGELLDIIVMAREEKPR